MITDTSYFWEHFPRLDHITGGLTWLVESWDFAAICSCRRSPRRILRCLRLTFCHRRRRLRALWNHGFCGSGIGGSLARPWRHCRCHLCKLTLLLGPQKFLKQKVAQEGLVLGPLLFQAHVNLRPFMLISFSLFSNHRWKLEMLLFDKLGHHF